MKYKNESCLYFLKSVLKICGDKSVCLSVLFILYFVTPYHPLRLVYQAT